MQINKFDMKFLLDEEEDLTMGGNGSGGDGGDEGEEEEINLDAPSIDTPSGLDADSIAQAVQRGLEGFQPQSKEPQQVQITPEQQMAFMKEMGRPEINEALVNELFGPGEAPLQQKRANLLQDLFDRAAKYALRVAGVSQNAGIADLQSRYDPLVKLQNQRLAETFYSQVEKSYPSLKGHGKIVQIASEQMQKQGYRSQGPEKDAMNLAVAAAKLIKTVSPEFTLKRAKTGGGRQGMPNMAASRSGAGGGVSTNRGTLKTPMSNAQRLYFGNKK